MPSRFHRVADTELLRLLDLPIHNGRAPDLQARLGPRGYDLAALDAAKTEHDAFVETLRRIGDLRGQAQTAKDVFQAAHAAFHLDTYMVHVGLARAALRGDHGARVSLGLDAPRARAYAAWDRQVRQFYGNARTRPGVPEALGRVGLTAAELDAALAALGTLDHLVRERARIRSEITAAAADRKRRRAALVEWLSVFRAVARIALRGKPEWLERLGIRHRSRP